MLVAGGLFGGLAWMTGNAAHDVIHGLVPGISHEAIEAHEDAATVALIAAGLLGAFSLWGLLGFRGRKRLPSWFIAIALAGSLVVSGLMARTANLGGKIRHTEILAGEQGKTPPESSHK